MSDIYNWNREDCLFYVTERLDEPLAEEVRSFILDRLANCRDPYGNMLRMLNEARGATGSWNRRHQPDRASLIPASLLVAQGIAAEGHKCCEECGDVFEPVRSTARYCGDACRKRASRKTPSHDVTLSRGEAQSTALAA